jgi:transketolase
VSLQANPSNAPVAIIANTTKGKGLAFMEGAPEWHHRLPTGEQAAEALESLERQEQDLYQLISR